LKFTSKNRAHILICIFWLGVHIALYESHFSHHYYNENIYDSGMLGSLPFSIAVKTNEVLDAGGVMFWRGC
jgi:hypothetical protein